MVDIVDQDNQVLYQSSKQTAHEKGLLHRTIIAEVINSKGEWLLVKQAEDRQDPGQFVSPVGDHIQSQESEIDALKREAMEEVGLSDFTFKFVGNAIYNRQVLNRIENHLFILYEIYSDRFPRLNQESVNFQYFTKEELNHLLKFSPLMFGDAFHFVVERFYPFLLVNH